MHTLWVVLEVIGAIIGLALLARIAWIIYEISTAVARDDGPHFAAMSRLEAEKRAAESEPKE